jgi:hypothetical protein
LLAYLLRFGSADFVFGFSVIARVGLRNLFIAQFAQGRRYFCAKSLKRRSPDFITFGPSKVRWSQSYQCQPYSRLETLPKLLTLYALIFNFGLQDKPSGENSGYKQHLITSHLRDARGSRLVRSVNISVLGAGFGRGVERLRSFLVAAGKEHL